MNNIDDKNTGSSNKRTELVVNAAKEAEKSYTRVTKNIADILPKFPKIDLPKFQLPTPSILTEDLKVSLDHEIIGEQNAWDRHKEMLDVQNSLLVIQKEILKEQKSTTKLTIYILILTIVGLVATLIFGFINAYGK